MYRGYVWDSFSGLYYLKSRYYNSRHHRFINADTNIGDIGRLLGSDLYAYCANSPVILYDLYGRDYKSALPVIVGEAIALPIMVLYVAEMRKKSINRRAEKELVTTSEVIKSMFCYIDDETMHEIKRNNSFWANNREILLCYPSDNNVVICYCMNESQSTFRVEYYYASASINNDWQFKKTLDFIYQFSDDPSSSQIIESVTSPWYSVMGYLWSKASNAILPESLMSDTTSDWKRDDPNRPHY